jgi:hypothetical protein
MIRKTATSDQPTQLPHRSGIAAAVTANGIKTAAMLTRRSRAVMGMEATHKHGLLLRARPTIYATFL